MSSARSQPTAWKDERAGMAPSPTIARSPIIREAWKYTSIDAFVAEFEEDSASGEVSLGGTDQPGLRVAMFRDLDDTRLATVHEVLAGIDRDAYPLTDLTLRNAHDGILLSVHGQLSEPVMLSAIAGGCSPVVIEVAPGAAIELFEESAATTFNSQLVLVRLGKSASMRHTRSALGGTPAHWSLLAAALDHDADYRLRQYQVGGSRRRTDCHIILAGQGAAADITGAYVTEDGRHLDQQMVVEHRAPNTVSRQKFHGLGVGRSRTVFNGRIHIHPGAGASDAVLSNRNLSLSTNAQINTKPELEIYTDDVRCAHGATVGQLSAESLFYLRSRGVPEPEARGLLCSGFLRECIAGTSAPKVIERFMGALR